MISNATAWKYNVDPKISAEKKTILLCEKSITSNDRIENAKHDFQEA